MIGQVHEVHGDAPVMTCEGDTETSGDVIRDLRDALNELLGESEVFVSNETAERIKDARAKHFLGYTDDQIVRALLDHFDKDS
jgi:hypothetical protein